MICVPSGPELGVFLMSIIAFMRLIAPPTDPKFAEPPSEGKGDERAVGIQLPTELISYASTYGSGVFVGKRTTRIQIFNPFSPHYITMVDFATNRLRAAREHGGESAIPFPIFPEKNGLLPIGSDDCGTQLCWHTQGLPDEWPILVQWERGMDGYEEVSIPFSDFLVKLFTRSIVFPCWPSRG